MTGPFATRMFRITFALAGCYNFAFGLWVAIRPLSFFELVAITPPRYPEIWACLGMVVGLYGLLYLHAAWKPQRARPIIAVGLGKILGPIGMAISFSDHWPHRLAMLNLYNDAIWWLPFTLFLLRDTRLAARLVAWTPWCAVALHALGLAAMGLILKHGTLIEPDPVQRATYIADNHTLWTWGWVIWMFSAVSLVAFYAWWAAKLTAPIAATAGVLLAALGSVFDLTGESLAVLMLPDPASIAQGTLTPWDPSAFIHLERTITLFTAGAANLLYSLGGIVLTLRTAGLPISVRGAMWTTWALGVGMTLAALMNHVGGLVVTTALLFPLLIVWTVWMALNWRTA